MSTWLSLELGKVKAVRKRSCIPLPLLHWCRYKLAHLRPLFHTMEITMETDYRSAFDSSCCYLCRFILHHIFLCLRIELIDQWKISLRMIQGREWFGCPFDLSSSLLEPSGLCVFSVQDNRFVKVRVTGSNSQSDFLWCLWTWAPHMYPNSTRSRMVWIQTC